MKPDSEPIEISAYSPDPTLTEQQQRIIARLACGWSVTLAARSEGIHRNTIGYWRRTIPAFTRELEFAAREQRRCWQDEAVELAPQALQTIGQFITDPKSSSSVRFRAAAYIIGMATDCEPAPSGTKGPRKPPALVQTPKTPKNAQSAQMPTPH